MAEWHSLPFGKNGYDGLAQQGQNIKRTQAKITEAVAALMIALVPLGLILDLIGVLLLGVDLVRIQMSLRRSAEFRISRLNDISSEFEGVGDWAKDIAKGAYWTEFHNTEGSRYEPSPGTFDPQSAKKNFEEAMEAVSLNSRRLDAIADIVISSYLDDKKTANASLVFSYAGLTLIVIGFSLQIIFALYSIF